MKPWLSPPPSNPVTLDIYTEKHLAKLVKKLTFHEWYLLYFTCTQSEPDYYKQVILKLYQERVDLNCWV